MHHMRPEHPLAADIRKLRHHSRALSKVATSISLEDESGKGAATEEKASDDFDIPQNELLGKHRKNEFVIPQSEITAEGKSKRKHASEGLEKEEKKVVESPRRDKRAAMVRVMKSEVREETKDERRGRKAKAKKEKFLQSMLRLNGGLEGKILTGHRYLGSEEAVAMGVDPSDSSLTEAREVASNSNVEEESVLAMDNSNRQTQSMEILMGELQSPLARPWEAQVEAPQQTRDDVRNELKDTSDQVVEKELERGTAGSKAENIAELEATLQSQMQEAAKASIASLPPVDAQFDDGIIGEENPELQVASEPKQEDLEASANSSMEQLGALISQAREFA